ncbi:hypothetical protein LMG27174_05252 [Paraburkholderia rhynchosiae]|uniref:Uncharacterized protein n=1 Tax=Paraburkholderia rhynchosiae TaxID=487049 RepID=A0A6J5C2A3_9BURK|nr:hypothetical protein LMG27174_05252 [Paraburkholderia rhynchosiae]
MTHRRRSNWTGLGRTIPLTGSDLLARYSAQRSVERWAKLHHSQRARWRTTSEAMNHGDAIDHLVLAARHAGRSGDLSKVEVSAGMRADDVLVGALHID